MKAYNIKIRKILVISSIIVLFLFISVSIYIHFVLEELDNIDILESKSYNELIVSDTDERSYIIFTNEFLANNRLYSVLEQLDEDVRIKLSEYMYSNNLQLKTGTYEIEKRVYRSGIVESISLVTFESIFEDNVFEFESVKEE